MKRLFLVLILARSMPAEAMTLNIPGFPDGSTATTRQAASADDCGGENVSPALRWRDVPAATRSLALTVFDSDAGQGAGYVHCVLYDLPPSLTGLPEAAGTRLPAGSVGGINSPGGHLYYGACPPVGDPPHHYIFRLYALDLPPRALPERLSEPRLRSAINGHILAQARTTLLYGRP